MEKINGLIEFCKVYFIDNQAWGGLFMIALGILLLVGAIKDWNWLFGDVSLVTYDLSKLDGIINVFGRKTGRVFLGIGSVIIILAGIAWFVLCIYKTILIDKE